MRGVQSLVGRNRATRWLGKIQFPQVGICDFAHQPSVDKKQVESPPSATSWNMATACWSSGCPASARQPRRRPQPQGPQNWLGTVQHRGQPDRHPHQDAYRGSPDEKLKFYITPRMSIIDERLPAHPSPRLIACEATAWKELDRR
jgi:hypothetical protein